MYNSKTTTTLLIALVLTVSTTAARLPLLQDEQTNGHDVQARCKLRRSFEDERVCKGPLLILLASETAVVVHCSHILGLFIVLGWGEGWKGVVWC